MADNRFKIKNGLVVEAGGSEITGSLIAPSITGSLFGTASWAQNAVSASSVGNLNQNLVITGSVTISGSAVTELFVLGDEQITGSLGVTNGIVAQSVTASFTGSLRGALIGTASWSSNSITASYVTGSIYTAGNLALSASYAISTSVAQTASFVNPLNQTVIISGSLIVTGSRILVGDTQITGSLLLTQSAISTVDYIDFTKTANPPHSEGRIHWVDDTKTLQVDTDVANLMIELGHQQVVRVRNQNPFTIAKGKIIYISGSSGNRPLIFTSSIETDSVSAGTVGMVAADIGQNNNGYVITRGTIRDINTNAYNAGQLLYLSTSGDFGTTAPEAPLHEVRIGKIVTSATAGIIYIDIMNGYEIGELHDVVDTNGEIGDLLVRSGSSPNNVFKNSKQLTGSYGVTGSWNVLGNINATTGITASLLGTSSLSNNSILFNGLNTASLILTSSAGISQTISGSLIINQNLTVLGSSSIIYVTSSQLDISTNIITVNTQNPTFRFGGLAVIDSGSSPRESGSILYDSVQDEWIFVHRGSSTSAVTSSHFLVGPETYNNLGNETYVPQFQLLRSTGNEHVTGSRISDDGVIISLNGNTSISGSTIVTGSLRITGSVNADRGFTGSLFGTASWTQNSLTASFVTGSIFSGGNSALSASYAFSASNSITSSNSLTASFILASGVSGLNLSLIRSGSVTASVNVNAETFKIVSGGANFIIVSSSGNTGFGPVNPITRVDVSGSFRVAGTINATTGSSYAIVSHSLTQPSQTGSQITELLVSPTFTYTAPNQTQTALKVLATFTGSSAITGSQANIIADFGATSIGSQLTINDVTSGSIYMVNDVSGLPIIEANSNWDVFIYDFPNTILKKTGSVIELGVLNNTGSFTQFKSDLVIDEGLGIRYRQAQVSGSTIGNSTTTLYNITFTNISSSVFMHAIVNGHDTGSREIITGEIRSTIKYANGTASIVGFNQSFANSDNNVVGFDIIAGSTSGSLTVIGTGSRVYQWGATITTQVM